MSDADVEPPDWWALVRAPDALRAALAAGLSPRAPGRDGHVDMVAFLLAHAMPLGHTDDGGRTLLALAREHGHAEIAGMLDRAGVAAAVDRTAEVLARWRAALATHRQAWPEWAALEAAASSERDWTWQQADGHLVRRDRTLSVCVLAAPQRATPAFATPLVNLRPDADLDRAGGVAGAATWGRVDRTNARELCPGAESVLPPDGVAALQTSRGGGLVAVDGAGEAVGFTGVELARIGTVEHLLRYCVREALAGRHWDQGLRRGADLGDHGLAAVTLLD